MKCAVVTKAEEIELETLALHHFHVGNIVDAYGGEVGLTGNGAETGKFRAIERYPVVVLLMFVYEGFQHLRCIILFVCRLATQVA